MLNGVKWWITGGSVASWYFVLARVEDRQTGFIVPADSAGIVRGPKEVNLGQHASNTVRVTFEDVKVPEASAPRRRGRRLQDRDGDVQPHPPGDRGGRLRRRQGGAGDLALVLEAAPHLRPQAHLQPGDLVQAGGDDDQARRRALLTYRAAWLHDNGLDNAREASEAKWFASDVAMEAAIACTQILGGYGYTNEMPAEKLVRDAKIYQIYEGASEIQKMVIVGKMMRSARSSRVAVAR